MASVAAFVGLMLLVAGGACGSGQSNARFGSGGSEGSAAATVAGSASSAAADDSDDAGTGDAGDGATGGVATSDDANDSTGSAGSSDDFGGSSDGEGIDFEPQDLPTVHGPCPEFVTSTVTFHPHDAASNDARLWVGDNPGGGPLVFYFHGTGMSADDATWSLGDAVIDAILDEGGVVLSPEGHGQYAWWIGDGDTREDDLRLIDEMVACAIAEADIDIRRIHATGLSSGATLTSDMIHRRSNYLASGSPKSGGFDPYNPVPDNVEPANKIAALIFHGGPSDTWGDPPYEFYEPQSEELATIITEEGGFAAICNHGEGHNEPTWDQQHVWQFFVDHPWNSVPSPYASGMPAAFPDYCTVWPAR